MTGKVDTPNGIVEKDNASNVPRALLADFGVDSDILRPDHVVWLDGLATFLAAARTVGSESSSRRQIALLLLPCIISASTSTCRAVNPRSAGDACGLTAFGVPMRISGGI